MRRILFGLILLTSLLATIASAEDGLAVGPPLSERSTAPVSPRRLSGRAMARMRHAIRRELEARRDLNYERFARYVAREVYPVNSYQPGFLNVFIDESGNICAAATIMTEDGLGELVRAQAEENNFLALGELREGPMYDWILASGFTQEEIATIQEPFYMPEEQQEPETEKDRLRARYQTILSVLQADRESSLRLATERLLAQRLAARS